VEAMVFLAMLLSMQDTPKVVIKSDYPVYWKQGSWTVYPFKDEESCDLGYKEANNEYLTIAYSAKEKFFRILITNKDASSLKNDQVVSLNVYFTKNGKMAESWNPIDFSARRMEGQSPILVSDMITSKALSDFEKNDVFAVMTRSDKIVSAYRLEGSAKAIEQLRSCGSDVAGINPNDPFMKD
jgi:hypothetical protein